MNSFNHYAYGAIGNWMYNNITGIKESTEKPGYKHFSIEPLITEQLANAKAGFNSLYGMIRSEWSRKDDQVELRISIPENTSATIIIQTSKNESVTEGDKALDLAFQAGDINKTNEGISIKTGSGNYVFKYSR